MLEPVVGPVRVQSVSWWSPGKATYRDQLLLLSGAHHSQSQTSVMRARMNGIHSIRVPSQEPMAVQKS